MTRLSERASASLPISVARPGYDRTQLRHGIVHLGLGAFHRAHQALYTEAAMVGRDVRWGIAGVSLRNESDAAALLPQDLLYCVLEREGDTVDARLVGGLSSALHAPSQLPAILDALADAQTQVVTSTVTEKGYCIHPATGDLDVANALIQHDLAHPEAPVSTIGVLVAGLGASDSADRNGRNAENTGALATCTARSGRHRCRVAAARAGVGGLATLLGRTAQRTRVGARSKRPRCRDSWRPHAHCTNFARRCARSVAARQRLRGCALAGTFHDSSVGASRRFAPRWSESAGR
jgi:hypothetical protein